MNENYDLIINLLMLAFFINMVTIGSQVYMMQETRLHIMAIHYLNGATLQVLIKQFVIEKLGIVALATLLGWGVLVQLKMANTLIMLMILMVAIILTVGISLILIYKLKNIELMLMLNQEDNLQ